MIKTKLYLSQDEHTGQSTPAYIHLEVERFLKLFDSMTITKYVTTVQRNLVENKKKNTGQRYSH